MASSAVRGTVMATVVQLLPTGAKSPMGKVSLPLPLLMPTVHALPEPTVGTSADISTVMLCVGFYGAMGCASCCISGRSRGGGGIPCFNA